MFCNHQQDTSKEFIMKPYGSGIQLIEPSHSIVNEHQNKNISPYFVADFLKIPSCVYFVNSDHVIKNINQITVDYCKYGSIRDAIGKGKHDHNFKDNSAQLLIENQKRVIQTQTMQILLEEVALSDDTFISGLSILKPWYDYRYKLIGVIGVSIVKDVHPLADILTLFSKNNFLNYEHYTFYNKTISRVINGVALTSRDIKGKFEVSTKSQLLEFLKQYSKLL